MAGGNWTAQNKVRPGIYINFTSKGSNNLTPGTRGTLAGIRPLSWGPVGKIMTMMDTLSDYTMGMTGGGAVDKNSMVDYATNLGKIMSGSYDAMTKKGFEFTEVQKAIIEGTASEAQVVAELGAEYLSMSSDMQAAAAINNVIAESWGGLYETMSNTPEGKIIQLQNRLGDLREMLGDALYPAVIRLVDTINDHYPQIERMLTYFAYGCSLIIDGITWVVDKVAWGFEWVEQNWDTVSTALVIGAIVVGAAMVSAAQASISAAAKSAAVWVAANWPLLLIVGSIALVIYMAREMGATWEEIGGVIGGVLYELFALGNNLIADAWNLIATFAEFFANVFNDPVAAIAHLFADLADWVLSILQSLASAIDLVFGSNLAGAVNSWRSGVQDWANSFGENEIKIQRMEKIQYNDAWDRGSEMGRSVGAALDNFNVEDFLSNAGGAAFDYSSMLNGIDGINDSLSDIGADTKAIKNSVALSEEDIKLLVDMATREYVNNINLTSQTPVITINGQNTGDFDADLQSMEESIKHILVEQLASNTSGAYA